jgi:TonB family protein
MTNRFRSTKSAQRRVPASVGFLCYAVGLLLVAHPTHVCAQDRAALTARLHSAETTTSIDSTDIAPWHLKLIVKLFDRKGAVQEDGSIEEWYGGPALNLITFTTSGYTGSVLRNGDGTFRTAGIGPSPMLLQVLLDQAVHPMPKDSEIDESQPELRKTDFGKVSLDCIMLSQPVKMDTQMPLGLFLTYCFDPGKDSLRASYNFGSQLAVRNTLGKFRGQVVSEDIMVSERGLKAASGHLEILNGAAIDAAIFTRDENMQAAGKPVLVSGGMMKGQLISEVQPLYPEAARHKHIQGSVMMRAVIGRDGRIHQLQLKSAPDPDLAIAALAAVRQWVYKSFLLNGEPADVDTTITVNVNMSP